jgi:hypothetical protein
VILGVPRNSLAPLAGQLGAGLDSHMLINKVLNGGLQSRLVELSAACRVTDVRIDVCAIKVMISAWPSFSLHVTKETIYRL